MALVRSTMEWIPALHAFIPFQPAFSGVGVYSTSFSFRRSSIELVRRAKWWPWVVGGMGGSRAIRRRNCGWVCLVRGVGDEWPTKGGGDCAFSTSSAPVLLSSLALCSVCLSPSVSFSFRLLLLLLFIFSPFLREGRFPEFQHLYSYRIHCKIHCPTINSTQPAGKMRPPSPFFWRASCQRQRATRSCAAREYEYEYEYSTSTYTR